MGFFIALVFFALGWLAWFSKAIGGPGLLAPVAGTPWLFRDGQLFLIANFVVFYSTSGPRAFQRLVLRPRGWCSTRKSAKRGEYIASVQAVGIVFGLLAILHTNTSWLALVNDDYWSPLTTFLLYPFVVLNAIAIRYVSMNIPVAAEAASEYGPRGTDIIPIAPGQLGVYQDTLAVEPPQPRCGPCLIDRPEGVSVYVLNRNEIISSTEIRAPAGQLEVATTVKVSVTNDLSRVNAEQLHVPGGGNWRNWLFDKKLACNELVKAIVSSEPYRKFCVAIEMHSQLLTHLDHAHHGVTGEWEMKISAAEREVQVALCSNSALPVIPLCGGLLQMEITVHSARWDAEERERYVALKGEVLAALARRQEEYQGLLQRYGELAAILGPKDPTVRRIWQEIQRYHESPPPNVSQDFHSDASAVDNDLLRHLLADTDPRSDPFATAEHALTKIEVQVPHGNEFRDVRPLEKRQFLDQWQRRRNFRNWVSGREALIDLLSEMATYGWVIRRPFGCQ